MQNSGIKILRILPCIKGCTVPVETGFQRVNIPDSMVNRGGRPVCRNFAIALESIKGDRFFQTYSGSSVLPSTAGRGGRPQRESLDPQRIRLNFENLGVNGIPVAKV